MRGIFTVYNFTQLIQVLLRKNRQLLLLIALYSFTELAERVKSRVAIHFHNRTSQVCVLLPCAQFERELHGPLCNDVGSLPLNLSITRLVRSIKSLLL